ncbi:MAG TPA: VanZ family protein [Burkholderiales bacterium]
MARILLAVYAVLTAYATLYPMEGWRDPGISPFAYLSAPWPRYFTRFDVAVNVLGYVPFGVLAVAALHPRVRSIPAFAAATAAAFALSLGLEALQSYLPARIASNLDALCNLLGAALGAALALRFVPRPLVEGPIGHFRRRVFLPGTAADAGLVVVGLWLFTQLNPGMLLFGAGDLRAYLEVSQARGQQPQFFILIEALVGAANLTAVGLLLSALSGTQAGVRARLLALVVLALAVKTAAFAIVMRAQDVLAWLTPGAQIGLAAGIALALAAVALPRVAQLAIAAMLIMAATVLVNLAPPNPYLTASLRVWEQGHFLNFNGLTRLVSALWPFAALGYLMFLAARRPLNPQ